MRPTSGSAFEAFDHLAFLLNLTTLIYIESADSAQIS